VDTPRRTYSPLFYAMAAAAMEMDVMVWFTMDGSNQLEKGAAEKVKLDPTSDVTLKTMLEQVMEAEVKLRVCQQSLALFDLTVDDLIEGVEILGATSIIDLALGADHVMYF
jgi:predicted peroxiredoxin